MCLVAIALDQSRRFPLVIASNRDEFFDRPAARLAWWQPRPDDLPILGGRDLSSGGTWLGLTATGRLALVTNIREPGRHEPNAPSRGEIVTRWLSGRQNADRFWTQTALSGYNGFNLVIADFQDGACFYGSSLDAQPRRLERGLYGLSNARLDAPWPKVEAIKRRTLVALNRHASLDGLVDELFAALADRSEADDECLPSTGVPLEWERALSPAFIRTDDGRYGTRASTLVVTERVHKRLVTHVLERSFTAQGSAALLRHAVVRGWPPRYATLPVQPTGPAHAEDIRESEVAVAVAADPPARKPRVRSLLRPPGR
ncbi:MAG: NRDE family protein [Ideonella sp.]|jgi:uncharacterized protein with NRDE domain|nr:NRDE family protein [Ideonella sp.]